MGDRCALCTDAAATQRIESPTLLSFELVDTDRVRGVASDVIVPLCEECERTVQDRLAEYENALGLEERMTAERRLLNLADRLERSHIVAASPRLDGAPE